MQAASKAFFKKLLCLLIAAGCRGHLQGERRSEGLFPASISADVNLPSASTMLDNVVTWRKTLQRLMQSEQVSATRCASASFVASLDGLRLGDFKLSVMSSKKIL